VGFDWWPLAARGDVFFVIGVFLLTPWVARALVRRNAAGVAPARGFLGVVLVAFLLAAVVSWTRDPTRVEGTMPAPTAPVAAAATPASPPPPKQDWTA
jgi:quinoprotein glucose dehydrogenase